MSPAAGATGLKVFGKKIGEAEAPSIRGEDYSLSLASQVLITYFSALSPSEATASFLVTLAPSSKETVTT